MTRPFPSTVTFVYCVPLTTPAPTPTNDNDPELVIVASPDKITPDATPDELPTKIVPEAKIFVKVSTHFVVNVVPTTVSIVKA